VPEGAVAENKKSEATPVLNGSRTVTQPIGALAHLKIGRAYAIARRYGKARVAYQIVSLYDRLMAMRPSPVVALNRAIAIAQQQGPERGFEEIRAIAGADRLASYPFYYAALGEFEFRAGKPAIAREHFRTALALARNPMERRFLEQRTGACEC
jgi:predicted RNA polymerase sigma factor